MALQPNFRRYYVALQYHGSSFLGFSYQKDYENCILPNGTDLRGYQSVEGRLRQAITSLVGGKTDNFDNVQVSSRTDRGVHAIKNTCHIDIRIDTNLTPHQIQCGLNYFLSRQNHYPISSESPDRQVHANEGIQSLKRFRDGRYAFRGPDWVRQSRMDELQILDVKEAPATMPNFAVMNGIITNADDNETEEWNVRHSAIQRTYLYRIFHHHKETNDLWGRPFEWDRSWQLRDHQPLDIMAMRQAAELLVGTHDFSAFRGRGCQRSSPVVTLQNIHIDVHNPSNSWGIPEGLIGADVGKTSNIIAILFQGRSFLYRQVRKMTGCLVQVGRGKIKPQDVKELLVAKDKTKTPLVAPAQGLFLVDVKHVGIDD